MAEQPLHFAPLDAAGGFPTAIDTLQDGYDDGENPRTLLELRICTVAGAIRDRVDWWKKVSQDLFVSKWQTEAGNSDEDVAVFNHALAEVRWQASHYNGPARPAAADGTFSTDGVNPSLLRRLLNGADKIRNWSRRDVHPGSNGLVIDLVHPSMYAYEQGVTPVIGDASVFKAPDWDKFLGDGAARPEEGPGAVNARISSIAGLAWLPSEFEVSADGKACNINSYINSLHPRVHEDMYTAISDAFVVALPLLEAVLNWIGKGSEPWEFPLRIPNDIVWISEGEDGYVKSEGDTHPLAADSDYDSERESDMLKMPSVPNEFVAPEMPDVVISLSGKKLQVIVKLSSIELTPEQPRYEGGSWHVEGMRNERIVATACMYLESVNIDESRIEFRNAIRIPDYEQGDDLGVKKVYGLRDHGPLVQPRGASRTIPGRVLAWPNTLQHRVRPFELADKARSGRRTILCFFLVDPTLRIRSTATVPPQINEWIGMEASAVLPRVMPKEVRELVGSYAGGMRFEDACERRQRLMEERRTVLKGTGFLFGEAGADFYERLFSLCEH